MDKIRIVDLQIFANHGVLQEEKSLGQKFLVSAELYTDFPSNDNIEDAVNYADICALIKDIMTTKCYDLIETVAYEVAKQVMVNYDKVKKVKIEVKKPWAPIKESLEYVSVVKELTWHKVLLGIGSNMGIREDNLNEAVKIIDNDTITKVEKVSTYINTSPVGGVKQDDFLNGAMIVRTLKTPYEMLDLIKEIENKLKRVRTIHWGPRTIDVDILLYDDLIMDDEQLIIPHIYMHEREFVLRPLCEIAPGTVHPILKKTVLQMLNDIKE